VERTTKEKEVGKKQPLIEMSGLNIWLGEGEHERSIVNRKTKERWATTGKKANLNHKSQKNLGKASTGLKSVGWGVAPAQG